MGSCSSIRALSDLRYQFPIIALNRRYRFALSRRCVSRRFPDTWSSENELALGSEFESALKALARIAAEKSIIVHEA